MLLKARAALHIDDDAGGVGGDFKGASDVAAVGKAKRVGEAGCGFQEPDVRLLLVHYFLVRNFLVYNFLVYNFDDDGEISGPVFCRSRRWFGRLAWSVECLEVAFDGGKELGDVQFHRAYFHTHAC